MKAFVAVALAAAAQAAPEADPQVLLAHQPLVYGNAHTQVHSQVKHANGAVVPGDTLSVKAAKVQHLAAKANAYLNKPLVYTHPVVQTVAAPFVHQTVASPVVSYTGAYPYGTQQVYGTHFIKREAEAEAEAQPEAEADPLLAVPYTTGVYPYTTGVYGAHHLAPVTYTHGAPVVYSNVAKTVVTAPVVKKVVTTPVVSYTGVYNTPLVHTPWRHTLIKREAEAEAEADPHHLLINGVNTYTGLYNGVPHVAHPITYTQAPVTAPVYYTHVPKPVVKTVVPTTVGSIYNYAPLAYNTHFIKREADAEAEADPALFYSNYGYTHQYPAYTTGYTTGHYAYNPPAYGYNTPYNYGYTTYGK